MRDDELPLFPLRCVLFPGGELKLRIFETRYLDMIRLCTREQRPFGVCWVIDGQEQDAAAQTAATGTSARVVDFYTLPDGMLGISCRGERRFHVERTRVRDNGLVVAEVSFLNDPDDDDLAEQQVRAEHGLLAHLLERILEQVGGPHAKAARLDFDRAQWVGCRLAELLPFDDSQRQRLLEADDPHDRLQRIIDALPSLEGDGDGEDGSESEN
jgi:hypothetical protein